MATNQNEYNQAIQNLIAMNKTKAEIKRIYKNASPGSEFKAQTVTNDMGDYSRYLVLFGYGAAPCALAIAEKKQENTLLRYCFRSSAEDDNDQQ